MVRRYGSFNTLLVGFDFRYRSATVLLAACQPELWERDDDDAVESEDLWKTWRKKEGRTGMQLTMTPVICSATLWADVSEQL